MGSATVHTKIPPLKIRIPGMRRICPGERENKKNSNPVCCLCNTKIPLNSSNTVEYLIKGKSAAVCFYHVQKLMAETCLKSPATGEASRFTVNSWLKEVDKMIHRQIKSGNIIQAQKALELISKFLHRTRMPKQGRYITIFISNRHRLPRLKIHQKHQR